MDRHIFSEGEWRRAKFLDHPTWSTCVSVDRKDYAEFSRPCPKVPSFNVVAKLHSCAQSCLWSKREFLMAGFKEEDLIPVSLGLNAANKSSIKIAGAILVRLNVKIDDQLSSCATMVYISPYCEGFYMSLEAMLDLNLFETFNSCPPVSGACNAMIGNDKRDAVSDAGETGESTLRALPRMSSNEPCTCPARTPPHERPEELPFPATPENNKNMELLQHRHSTHVLGNTYPRWQAHQSRST